MKHVASFVILLCHCFGVLGEAVSSVRCSSCSSALLDRRRSSSGTFCCGTTVFPTSNRGVAARDQRQFVDPLRQPLINVLCTATTARSGTRLKRLDLGDVERRVGYVIEEIRKASDDDTGNDLNNFRVIEASLTGSLQVVVIDFTASFQDSTRKL